MFIYLSFRPLIGVIICKRFGGDLMGVSIFVSVPLSGLSSVNRSLCGKFKWKFQVSVPLSGLSSVNDVWDSVDWNLFEFPSPYRGYHL